MTIEGYAQTPCKEVLKRAQASFDAGHLERVPKLLGGCIDNLNRRDKTTALRLITLSQLFQSNISEAEETLVQLLNVRPDYKVDFQNDPAEFINLYKKYRTEPVYSIGFKIGSNITFMNILDQHDIKSETPDKLIPQPSFIIGASFDRLIRSKIFANVGLNFKINKFVIGEEPDILSTKELTETQSLIELPVSISYVFGDNDFKPFVFGGFSGTYLLSDKANNILGPGELNDPPVLERVEVDIDFLETNQHYRLNSNAFIGGGLKIKTGIHQTIVETKYSFGLFNVADNKRRFDDVRRSVTDFIIDDDYVLNTFEITVGFKWNFYKISKIK